MTRILLIAVAALSLLTCGCSPGSPEGVGTFSEGLRSGYVVKMSKKGTVAKTWEGQLAVGFGVAGVARSGDESGSSIVSSTFWSFSVSGEDAEETVQALESALRSGERVVLNYRQARIRGLAETDYFIESVELPDR